MLEQLTQVLPGILEHINVTVEVGGRHPKYVLSVRSDTDADVSYSYPCAPLAELLTRLKALLDTAAGSGKQCSLMAWRAHGWQDVTGLLLPLDCRPSHYASRATVAGRVRGGSGGR